MTHLLQQSHENCVRFLAHSEDLTKFVLGFFERRLLGFHPVAILGELAFDLVVGSLGFDRFLQRFGVRVGFASKTLASIGISSVISTISVWATSAPAAASPEKAAS